MSNSDSANFEPLFYLQDSRNTIRNSVLWWKNGGGYTTDLREAAVYTKQEAQRMHSTRSTDIPWPKEYIDGQVHRAVDFQYLDPVMALRTGQPDQNSTN